MWMIWMVLDKPDLLEELLEAFTAAGISGLTMMESSGIYRRGLPHIPMRYMIGQSQVEECGNVTLWAMVKSETEVQACLAAAERVTGGMEKPNTGVFCAWPLALAVGLNREGG